MDINDIMTILREHTNEVMQHPVIGERLEESLSALDISGYNYMRGRYEMDINANPNRILFGSETYPPEIDRNWEMVETYPQVLGDFTWTGWDYIGEAGVGVSEYNTKVRFFKPYPAMLGYCGDYDIFGNRRPISYFREIVWGLRTRPYLSVDPPLHYRDRVSCTPWTMDASVESWNWNGYEGKPIRVRIFSSSEEVELLLNGKSLGRVRTGKEKRFQAIFETLYYPGELEVIALNNGKEVGRNYLKTAKEEVSLTVTPDRDTIKANGEDLVFLELALKDEEGNINPSIDKRISVQVTGAGSLQGIGSANPCGIEGFCKDYCETWQGRAMAVVRAGRKEGVICIRLKAEDEDAVCVEIKVVK